MDNWGGRFKVCIAHYCTLSTKLLLVKNKYDLTFCQSRLHTASETFVRHNKIWIGFDFFTSVERILRCVLTVQSHQTSKRQNPQLPLKFIHFISQHKALQRGNLYISGLDKPNIFFLFSLFKKREDNKIILTA